MKFEDVLRESERIQPDPAAVERWRCALFAPESVGPPSWVPSLASGLAMAGMFLLLWPAAARGPVLLRSAGEACDGRWEFAVPLRADVRALARPVPTPATSVEPGRCESCHLAK